MRAPSNLPPGVTDNMLPGNRQEDIAIDAIYLEFVDGDLGYFAAIQRLEDELGYDPKEAEQVVSEWAEWADNEARS